NALRPYPAESVEYDTTKNLYIEGDNLEVLKILKNMYKNKVKMIYIDPPYNTGKDFIYKDNFHLSKDEYDEMSGTIDDEGNRLVENKDSNPRYHTDWLNMIYPRLKLAKDLLTDDGVIFISIDDNEVHNLRKICDEVFGEENFVGGLIHQRAKGGGQAKYIVKGHDYIHVYAKDISLINLSRQKILQKKTYIINGKEYIKNDDIVRKVFGKYDKSLGDRRCFYEELEKYKGITKKKEIDEKIKKGEYFLEKNKDGLHIICKYELVSEAKSKLYSIIKVLSEKGIEDVESLKIDFTFPKPVDLLHQLITAGGDKSSLILDFFSGSATTAHAVMQLNAEDGGNRRYICVQIPEVCEADSEAIKAGYQTICDIGKERIRRAGVKIKESQGLVGGDLDIGFRVLKLDSSNMADHFYTPSETTQDSLKLWETSVKDDRTGEDLLYQVMIELGIDLTTRIEKVNVQGFGVYIVGDDRAAEDLIPLVACFDRDIPYPVLEEIAGYNMLNVAFGDISFQDDSQKVNCEILFRRKVSASGLYVL
ncbi:MAG: site-specific DNA-methyltransferase, partial [Candidatus Cloacimonetes bacterium]|nr:site-specific DNA-methyltransferase [Candidatus Cloacimonadota bacterium]